MITVQTTTSDKPEFAISIENLGKLYTIGRQRAAGDGMRHVLENVMRAPLAWLRSKRQRKIEQVDFWALKGVSAQIKHGEVVGIIGRNGAGKSTLLKILSRITIPTEGRICIDGRIASLLEVGTGFHPELTGRENVFLNGSILGMTRSEIMRKFDEIVEFSEIEEFLDTPVKRYSSGMYVRLAFAVAAHLDPEILICDEVLSVGDLAFQKKCLSKIRSFAQSGKTVLFVSHNTDTIRNLCQRVLWIKDGRLHQDGAADDVLEVYSDSITKKLSVSSANPDFGLTIEKVVLKNARGEKREQFVPGEDLVVEISYDAQKRVEGPIFALKVLGLHGSSCFTSNMLLDGNIPESLQGTGQLACTFRSIPLLPQNYTITLGIRAANVSDLIIPFQEVASFSVVGDLAEYGYRGQYEKYASYSTSVVVPYEWRLPDGTIVPVALDRAAFLQIDSHDFSFKE